MFRKVRRKCSLILGAIVGILFLLIMFSSKRKQVAPSTRKECVAAALYKEYGNNSDFFGRNVTGNHSMYTSLTWKQILNRSTESTLVFDMPFYKNYSYPLNVNMTKLVHDYRTKGYTAYHKINVYPYDFTKRPNRTCDNIYVVFLIKSAIQNYQRRESIRDSWMSDKYLKALHVQRVFLLGSRELGFQKRVDFEHEKYRDILQMDFKDDYYNNTWKTRGGFKWTSEYCSSAKYVVLVDDDFYFATNLLVQLLNNTVVPENLYMGWVNRKPTPFRSRSSKWYIPESEYGYDKYPAFVSAGTVIMSMNFVQNVNIASQYVKHFKFDDVFIAIVANKLGVRPLNNVLVSSGKIQLYEKRFWTFLNSHGYDNPNDVKKTWQCHLSILHNTF